MFIKKRSPTWKCDSNCINVLQERWFPNLEVRLHLSKSFSFSSESFSQTALVVEVGLQSRLQLRDLHFECVLCRLKTRPLIFPRAVCYVFFPHHVFSFSFHVKSRIQEFFIALPAKQTSTSKPIPSRWENSHLRMTLSFSKSLIFSLAWWRDCL